MIYKPLTNNSTSLIIEDIKEYLKGDLPSQVTIDTGDLPHLIGEIERLNNIINEIDFYIYEKMRTIYIRADGDIGKYSFKALEEVWHKVRELKGSDKE